MELSDYEVEELLSILAYIRDEASSPLWAGDDAPLAAISEGAQRAMTILSRNPLNAETRMIEGRLSRFSLAEDRWIPLGE